MIHCKPFHLMLWILMFIPLNSNAQLPKLHKRIGSPRKVAAATTHERFATFLADANVSAKLSIQNLRLDIPLTVRPALLTSQGEIELSSITIPAHSVSTVDINSELKSHNQLDTQGAVVVRYDCPSYGSLSAVVQMSDYVHKLYLNSIAQSAEEYWYGTTLDAVVWSPDKRVSGFMSMINTSTEPKSVQVSFIVKGVIRDLQEIQIAPHQLRKLPIDSLIKNSLEAGAGIHIAFSGKPGEIVAEGTLLNKKTGFSKYLRFVDKDLRYSSSSIKSNFLFLGVQPVEDGFPTGLAFRSVAVMRNISSVSTQVTPVVQYLIDASVRKVSLPPLALKAGESRVIDFAKEQAAGRLPADLRQGTLELDPDSNQAAVIGELFNFNDNGPGYVVGPSFTAHPARATAALWRTDGTFQTTIVIQNTGQDD